MITFTLCLLALLIGVLFGFVGFRMLVERQAAKAAETLALSAAPSVNPALAHTSEPQSSADLYKIAETLQAYFDQSAHPKDMLTNPDFERGVQLLLTSSYSTGDLFSYASGTNTVICCLAFEALSRRTTESIEQDVYEPTMNMLGNLGYWPLYFTFRALNKHTDRPLIGAVLSRVNLNWRVPSAIQILREFIEGRVAAGETAAFSSGGDGLERMQEQDEVENLENALREIGESLTGSLLEQVQQYRLSHFLRGIGRIWGRDEDRDAELLIEHEYLNEQVQAIESALYKRTPRSVLLVGETGVGKTAMTRALAKRLQQQGWMIFEASAVELMAGQIYYGELEGRVQTLLKQLSKHRKTLWFVPNFQDLLWAGQHRHSQAGVLDHIFSYIESGEIVVLGETQPAAYERLLQAKPRLRTAMETVRVNSLGDDKTLGLAEQWVAHYSGFQEDKLISDQTLHEAFQLSKQFLGEKASPGNLLQFLSLTRRRMLSINPDAQVRITLDDMLVTLAQLTGLPISILDDRHGLDLEALREYFQRRVLGQPEAIDCLVERVAMIKAGVTDPKRPQGVFLFAGPTGTGKTEIAKTLAKFLFGSEERMLRVDMSELQGPNGLGRIIGEFEENSGQTALVNQIRRQPFSVILLDEFEKADPSVWDLFLQVFDDGRLTDRRGNTADFRHSIIIMTSNLGAAIPHGSSVGFNHDTQGFSLAMVERTIANTFRREFVNRLDRVVVFRPLSRATMRDLLKKELNDVLQRRGLRNREWAVEWDDSAIEFLLDKGFTHDLGARPLKRAIERYLLSSLAMTIVNHQFPAGDQFLFVRSDGKQIEVEFVDHDPPGKIAVEIESPPTIGESDLGLEQIALDAQGTAAEVEFLQDCFEQLVAEVESEDWQAKKNATLLQTSARGFWESASRFSVLGVVEYMDRIEAGLRTGESLLRRIVGFNSKDQAKDRQRFSADLVRRLAQQIYLLEIACDDLADSRPRDAFLQVEGGRDAGVEPGENDEFARRLVKMYEQWAANRKMKLEVIECTNGNGRQSFRWLAAVSGYGAFSLLLPEAGFHVFEAPRREGSFLRYKARVRVTPAPDEPAGNDPNGPHGMLKLAKQSFDQIGDAKLVIVRRYREAPSPLVRDGVRQWRTGRIDRVFSGDFDLIR
ncbi:MAG: AAA family ATPase [Acidobacteriota bacterium]|nr:AAA family ATPase [Acidobacteriota bacterium]